MVVTWSYETSVRACIRNDRRCPRRWILAVQLGVHTQDNEADEGDDGKGAQDAACEAAGVPTSASDINYEDETGVGPAGSNPQPAD